MIAAGGPIIIVKLAPVVVVIWGIYLLGEWFLEWCEERNQRLARRNRQEQEADRKFWRVVFGVFVACCGLSITILFVSAYSSARQKEATEKKQFADIATEQAAAEVRQREEAASQEVRRQENEVARKEDAERREKEAVELAERARLQAIENAQNDPTAKRLFTFRLKQATEGGAVFQYDLAQQYLNGQGIAKDVSVAKDWLKKAAAQGHKKAQAQLAELAGTESPVAR